MCWENKMQIVLIGDSFSGKTALAARLSQDLILRDYIPTEFDDFSAEVNTRVGSCKLTVLDTSGKHEDCRVRSLAYQGCDAVIICFDLTDQSSLESVESKWLPELDKYCPGVPFYIAGCKRDATCSGAEGCVCAANCCLLTDEELTGLIERTGAVAYTECSAFTSDNVEQLFQVVVETAPTSKKTSARKLVASLKKKAKGLRKLSKSASRI